MSEFKTNKAVFVGVILEKGGERKVQEYLDELAFLAETAGAIPDKMFTQRLDRPDKATYIGPGKLDEIKQYCEENEIEYVIFDDELTGMQQRNIEKIIACSFVGRYFLLCDGFSAWNTANSEYYSVLLFSDKYLGGTGHRLICLNLVPADWLGLDWSSGKAAAVPWRGLW